MFHKHTTTHHLNVEAPRKRRRAHPEDDLQTTVREFLDLALPRGSFFFHPANGKKRDVITAALLKAMGVKAGVPDIIIGYDGRGFAIELKTDQTNLSVDQRAMHAQMRAAGWRVEVARSLEEVVRFLDEFGIPLRLSENDAMLQRARRAA